MYKTTGYDLRITLPFTFDKLFTTSATFDKFAEHFIIGNFASNIKRTIHKMQYLVMRRSSH